MHTLIVVAHPATGSLTHAMAAEVAAGVQSEEATWEIADLAAEKFDPCFSSDDVKIHSRQAPIPPELAIEHARIDRADALVLVYPVYWWSFPGLLKGWIDRVFCNGWAYNETPGTGLVKKLQRLHVHLLAIGGADLRTYARHGYFAAMRTQIEHGIFDYCGAQVIASELLLPPDNGDWASQLRAARGLGAGVVRARQGLSAVAA